MTSGPTSWLQWLLALLLLVLGWLPVESIVGWGDRSGALPSAAVYSGEQVTGGQDDDVSAPLDEIIDEPLIDVAVSEDPTGPIDVPPGDDGGPSTVGEAAVDSPGDTGPDAPGTSSTTPADSEMPRRGGEALPSDPDPSDRPSTTPRLDDPVLRWLPELTSASSQTGVPAALLAAVVRVTSGGDPNVISPQGGRGLLWVPADEFRARRVPADRWHDPATNALVGAQSLAELRGATKGWEAAIVRYRGSWCDPSGACGRDYADAAMRWRDHYNALLTDDGFGGLGVLPAGWTPPPIDPRPQTTFQAEYPGGGAPDALRARGGRDALPSDEPIEEAGSTRSADEQPGRADRDGKRPRRGRDRTPTAEDR